MKKHLIQEFGLPLFWLFFFIVSKNDPSQKEVKRSRLPERQEAAGQGNLPSKNKAGTFSKTIILPEL
jgi:hypothetical protein